VRKENKTPGDISYFFCSDEYIYQQNVQFLNHNTLTDIITFDDCVADLVQGNILISFDRVEDNAKQFGVELQDEILRVLAHGVLHLCGYKDKTDEEAALMRKKENEAIELYYNLFISKNQ
jgi:rRNA maturation RNase YbeY